MDIGKASNNIKAEILTSGNATLDIVLPVYNEENILEANIGKLIDFFDNNINEKYRVIIADNGSSDRTPDIAVMLADKYPAKISCIRLVKKGRGAALKQVWLNSQADILGYMDIDLSTDLKGFVFLISAISKNGADIAIGSRAMAGSITKRLPHRKILSLIYHLLVKIIFGLTKVSDFQCGFKACKRISIYNLLRQIKNEEWFFDTELLITAWRAGLKIKEIPVNWTENHESKVRILKDIFNFLFAMVKFRFGL